MQFQGEGSHLPPPPSPLLSSEGLITAAYHYSTSTAANHANAESGAPQEGLLSRVCGLCDVYSH